MKYRRTALTPTHAVLSYTIFHSEHYEFYKECSCRSVGVRLGQGEELHCILASSKQVAEGVSTAGVVVSLARKYRVKLPVLTAVAHILDSNLSPKQAVAEIMSLPQIEER